MFKPCVVIPVFDHERALGAVVEGVLAQNLPCVLVDDGSSDRCSSTLNEIAMASPQSITLLRHAINRGKGGAVLTGLRYAAEAGYTHAVQIDADGQHRAADIPRFIEQALAHPEALIVGHPEYDSTVPRLRLYARYLTHVWVSINTLSRQIKDSMCGFRVYPLSPVIALDQRIKLGARMNFDTEVLVRLYWEGLQILNVSTPVVYPADGISHFRGCLDNALLSRMHATLFFGMLLRLPKLIARQWSAR
ncbi:MAG TPA: glycosyltransferase family 2 protein [Candidatus Binatia bacterium]|nr:glycosyltransferase family 2 protein [Candidatus Binatia bacterium]